MVRAGLLNIGSVGDAIDGIALLDIAVRSLHDQKRGFQASIRILTFLFETEKQRIIMRAQKDPGLHLRLIRHLSGYRPYFLVT